MNKSNTESLITPAEAASLLGIKVGTLTIWRTNGKYNLPFVKVGRLVKYKESDIQAFIKRRTMQHTSMEAA